MNGSPPLGARVRHGFGLAVTAVTALAIDLWLRVAVIRRYRNDPARLDAGVVRITRIWARAVFGIARFFLGLRVRVEGTAPSSGRYIVLSNHQSSLDIPLVITTLDRLDLRFVAMERLRHGHPVVSAILRHGGAAFVKKENLAEDFAELTRFARGIDRLGASALIFPEGGLARDGVLQPFRLAGIEAVRAATSLPILPVTVDGLWPAPTIKEYARLAGARVTVRIGEPIPTEAIEADPREAYAKIEARLRANLEAMRREGAGR